MECMTSPMGMRASPCPRMAPMARNRIVAQAAIRFRSYPDQAGRCGGTRLRAAAAIFDAIREVVRLVDEADPAFAAVFHREDRRRHVVGLRDDDPADVVQVVYPDGRNCLRNWPCRCSSRGRMAKCARTRHW